MKKVKVGLCFGKRCMKYGSNYIAQRILREKKVDEKEFDKLNIGEEMDLDNIVLYKMGCIDQCGNGPNVKIDDEIISNATPIGIWNIISKKLNE